MFAECVFNYPGLCRYSILLEYRTESIIYKKNHITGL